MREEDPDARWRKDEQSILSMAAQQQRLLEGGAAQVRPGGVLVYSVCSLEPEETSSVVESFLKAHPEFTPEEVDRYLPSALRSGGFSMIASPQRNGTDGVFAARFRKR